MIEKRRVLVEKYCDSFLVQILTFTHINHNWWYISRLGEQCLVEYCTKDSYEAFKIFSDNDELLTYNYWDYYLNKEDGAYSIVLKKDCKRVKKMITATNKTNISTRDVLVEKTGKFYI